MNNAHEETYKDCTIELVYDDNPTSPREWDNVGTMVCWHRRYKLGDEQPTTDPDEYLERLACGLDARLRFWRDLRESCYYRYHDGNPARTRIERHFSEHLNRVLDEHFVILPLYLYDHGGITMSTGAFSCPWDSGQVGFIYCTMKRAGKEWTEDVRAKAEACLRSEVSTYSAYLEGNVVGWIAKDPSGEHIDSCWGYFPDERGRHDHALDEARSAIDHWCEEQEVEATERAHWEARDTITA